MSKITSIDVRATQAGLAEIVGTSQQAINKHHKTGIFKKNGKLRDWIIVYCEKIRGEAAGRGGDEAGALTRARTRQAEADADNKELSFQVEIKNLIPMEEIEPQLDSWATVIRSEYQYAIEKMVAAIESQHKIKVEQKLIDETVSSALASVASYADQFVSDDAEDSEQV